ncbi:unnamed protein product, partial [Iphiclides podalirius]
MRLTVPAILFLLAVLFCVASGQYPRLRRPERFDTAEQISNYLKELQEYYSVHGRGRYGKRQMHIADASVTFREAPVYEHIMDQDGIFKNLGYNK